MTTGTAPDVTDAYSSRFIREAVDKLIAGGLFSRADREDLQQDLFLALLEGVRNNYDPERAKWTTFVRAVVSRKAISLARSRMAGNRNGEQLLRSLQDMVPHESGEVVELSTLIREDQDVIAFGVQRRDTEDSTDLHADVELVLAKMPADMQHACRVLQRVPSVAAAARELGIPRTTLVSRLKHIREYFEDAGLRVYLRQEDADAPV